MVTRHPSVPPADLTAEDSRTLTFALHIQEWALRNGLTQTEMTRGVVTLLTANVGALIDGPQPGPAECSLVSEQLTALANAMGMGEAKLLYILGVVMDVRLVDLYAGRELAPSPPPASASAIVH